MGIIRKNFRYKLIKNFLSKKELEIGVHYFNLMHKRNETNFDQIQGSNCDSIFRNDCFTDALLVQKKKIMEKETGLKLFPTYGFTRFYTYNSDLEKHKDRPSCEISVSAMWDSDGTEWPLYIEGKAIEMNKGDAVIYLGCEDEHWREVFKGDYHLQTFFHYVDQNGPNKDHKYDKIKHPHREYMKYNPEI
tara:strand:- start:825 stop:1394 length:570 start_codon:yes stop_codon:yes gene_type:complete